MSNSVVDQVVSLAEAAQILGISAQAVGRHALKGRIEARRLNGKREWICSRQSVLAYKAERDKRKLN